MNIRCENCRASYLLNVAMFKGSRGMMVRCRRCGNSILVLKPEEIVSDTSVSGDEVLEGSNSGNRGADPAVSPCEEEHSPSPAVEQVPSIKEGALIWQNNWEEEKLSVPSSVPGNAFSVNYLLFPKSPPRDRRRRTIKLPSIIAFSLLFILLVGKTVSLVFPLLGKQVLADIGQRIYEASTIFRS